MRGQDDSSEIPLHSHLESRRSSDQDHHSAAAALSSLGRVATPTVGTFHETTPSTALYRTPDQSQTPGNLPIISPPPPPTEETYEWDEGGDDKELGIDAMGAASTRDYKPGFFGMIDWLPC